jgi:hypothetical protein
VDAPGRLLERQAALQREARRLLSDLRVEETLGAAGPTAVVGSYATGLMVWRDLDAVVDAPGLPTTAAFELMLPLLGRCRTARYVDDPGLRRHYFVLRVPWREVTWKLDVSIFLAGVPSDIAAFQQEVRDNLKDETRLTVLTLKDAWKDDPAYPEVVGGFEICDAVLNHGVRSLDELDAYLLERGLSARS